MSKQGAAQRQRVQAALWSEFLALWFDRTRRRALPLLLATLLLLIPTLPASAECTCEVSSTHHHEAIPHGSQTGHQHEHAGAEDHHGHAVGHSHTHSPQASTASVNGGHAHAAHMSHMAPARGETACCACPRVPVVPSVAAATPPSGGHADSHALVYTRPEVLPAFRFDALTGLFGRAGPSTEGKPKLLFLASLAGRAPPVSIL